MIFSDNLLSPLPHPSPYINQYVLHHRPMKIDTSFSLPSFLILFFAEFILLFFFYFFFFLGICVKPLSIFFFWCNQFHTFWSGHRLQPIWWNMYNMYKQLKKDLFFCKQKSTTSARMSSFFLDILNKNPDSPAREISYLFTNLFRLQDLSQVFYLTKKSSLNQDCNFSCPLAAEKKMLKNIYFFWCLALRIYHISVIRGQYLKRERSVSVKW